MKSNAPSKNSKKGQELGVATLPSSFFFEWNKQTFAFPIYSIQQSIFVGIQCQYLLSVRPDEASAEVKGRVSSDTSIPVTPLKNF